MRCAPPFPSCRPVLAHTLSFTAYYHVFHLPSCLVARGGRRRSSRSKHCLSAPSQRLWQHPAFEAPFNRVRTTLCPHVTQAGAKLHLQHGQINEGVELALLFLEAMGADAAAVSQVSSFHSLHACFLCYYPIAR